MGGCWWNNTTAPFEISLQQTTYQIRKQMQSPLIKNLTQATLHLRTATTNLCSFSSYLYIGLNSISQVGPCAYSLNESWRAAPTGTRGSVKVNRKTEGYSGNRGKWFQLADSTRERHTHTHAHPHHLSEKCRPAEYVIRPRHMQYHKESKKKYIFVC